MPWTCQDMTSQTQKGGLWGGEEAEPADLTSASCYTTGWKGDRLRGMRSTGGAASRALPPRLAGGPAPARSMACGGRPRSPSTPSLRGPVAPPLARAGGP